MSNEDRIDTKEVEEEKLELVLAEESERETDFPWDDDEEFKCIQEANETKRLIVAYVAVFNDSIPEAFNNIELVARQINGTVLKPGEVFFRKMK